MDEGMWVTILGWCKNRSAGKCPSFKITNGCPVRVNIVDLAAHEEECDFRECVCPYPDGSCTWKGYSNQVLAHLFAKHKIPSRNGMIAFFKINAFLSLNIFRLDEILVGDTFLISAKKFNHIAPLAWIVPMLCHGQAFLVMIGKQKRGEKQQCFVIVYLLGSKRLCEKFSCSLELTARDRSKYVWKGTPQPIFDEAVSVVENEKCFLFEYGLAAFCSSRGSLPVLVSITIESDPSPGQRNERLTSAYQQFQPD
ncbi:unnamed protein product [Orchesella dallaii]|uniref:E3 ubiquitin-protein ligase n=1 Tax=Orchesella dallaii TaxID=48710 RepID=A0ABP1QJD0_9HEXA